MPAWTRALELDENRQVTGGSEEALSDVIRRGADLRIETAFRYNEHVDVTSDNCELIQEVCQFRVTYLLEDRWTAGFMTLRQPTTNFGEQVPRRPSMSFFMYSQNGQQAIARPYLDGAPPTGTVGPGPLLDHSEMPKYHQQDSWDVGTRAPSSNFIYDFETYRFWVCDQWQQVLAHTSDGTITSGSMKDLTAAFETGCELKVGLRGLCADLSDDPSEAVEHEVFVHVDYGYNFTGSGHLQGMTLPVVRVRPAVPLKYISKGWDFGWLLPRTDGRVLSWLCDPYTLKFHRTESRLAIRWFVNDRP